MGRTHDQRTMTPPTLPTPALQQHLRGPSQWPTVIGVLAIIFGAFEVLGGCVGIVSPWFMSVMVEVLPQEQSLGMAAMVEWGGWMVASSLAGLGIGVLLLLGGVSLMQRRPRGRTMCLTWALLRIPVVVLGLVVGYLIQQDHLVASSTGDILLTCSGGFGTASRKAPGANVRHGAIPPGSGSLRNHRR